MENINETPPHTYRVVVSIMEIKGWLKQGVTRRIGDPGYNAEIGSIQEKYAMNKAEVTALFQDPRLKGLKVCTPKPSRIIIAEDIVDEDIPVQDNTMPGMGEESTPSTNESETIVSDTDEDDLGIPRSGGMDSISSTSGSIPADYIGGTDSVAPSVADSIGSGSF